MSIAFHGMSLLNCVCKCNKGLCRIFNPFIHIFAGEKVCIHAIMPIQFCAAFASLQTDKISSGVVTTGLKTMEAEICFDALRSFTISCECSATFFNVSSPYKCWLPVMNQTSKFPIPNGVLFIFFMCLFLLMNHYS